jgi:hypothetical protein
VADDDPVEVVRVAKIDVGTLQGDTVRPAAGALGRESAGQGTEIGIAHGEVGSVPVQQRGAEGQRSAEGAVESHSRVGTAAIEKVALDGARNGDRIVRGLKPEADVGRGGKATEITIDVAQLTNQPRRPPALASRETAVKSA